MHGLQCPGCSVTTGNEEVNRDAGLGAALSIISMIQENRETEL
jgi:hypothetical protein